MVKKGLLASALFAFSIVPAFGDTFFQIASFQRINNTTYSLKGIKLNSFQLYDLLKGYPYTDRLNLSTIKVASVSFTTDGKVILKNLKGNGLYLERLEVSNANGTLKVKAIHLELHLKELFKNYPFNETLKIESLLLEKESGSTPRVEIKKVHLFGGTVESIILTPNRTAELKKLQGVEISKVLQLANYFKPLNGLSLEGNLNLDAASVDLNTLSVKLSELNLKQGYYKGVFIKKFIYSPEGLKIEGKIKNFHLTAAGQSIKVKGKFNENRLLKDTYLELKVKLPELATKLKGNINFNGKEFFLLADKLELKLNPKKKNENHPNNQNEPSQKKLPKITIPDLPLEKFKVLVKELTVDAPLSVPYFKLRPFEVKNVELTYLGKEKLYTFHLGVCYTDLWGYRDKEQNISFLFTVPFVPISALKGCFLEEINHPYLRDIFTSGYVNLFLGGFVPKGELSQMSGFLTFSLLDGYFYTERSLQLPGKLNLAYSLASAAFKFIGVDLTEFTYNLHLSGDFRIRENEIGTYLDTTAYVKKPKTFLFRGITKLFYNLETSQGSLTVEGNTALPWGSLTIIKQKKNF